MNILVIGGGLLGRSLAEMLDADGHEVAIIEENEENLELLNANFQGVTSVGFPMDIKSLKAAGIESCDAVAVATPDDNLNITVGQIVKNVFGVEKVIARISDPYRENVFESFGLQTVCPTNMASETMMSAIISPLQGKQVTFGTSTIAVETTEVDKKLYGKRISELEIQDNFGVFGIIKSGGKFVLKENNKDIVIEPNDLLVYTRKID